MRTLSEETRRNELAIARTTSGHRTEPKRIQIVDARNLETHRQRLEELPITALRTEFRRVVGWSSKSRNRSFLIRKILFYLQVAESGDINETARDHALAIADFRDLFERIPGKAGATTKNTQRRTIRRKLPYSRDPRIPIPGTVLTRNYRDREIKVQVLPDGFEWNGKQYRSLSAIAKAATGTKWNGLLFFGLTQ